VLAYGILIAVLTVQHLGYQKIGSRPGHVIGIVVVVIRRHVGNLPFLTHGLLDIIEPLGIQPLIVKQVAFTPASCGSVTQPGLTFIALRAIHGHAFVIAHDTPPGVIV